MPNITKAIRPSSGVLKNIGLTAFVLLAFGLILCANYVLFNLYPSLQNKKDKLEFDYVVVSKEVGALNTLLGTTNGLSPQLVNQVLAVDQVEDAAFFKTADFKIDAQAGGSMIPAMQTLLFLESVPTRFLDFDTSEWDWEPGQDLQVAIPRTYLELYNYGFSQGNNLPQISEGLIKNFAFKIRIRSAQNSNVYNAKLANFTNRLNTILVPESFLDFANEKYGSGSTKSPARMLVKLRSQGSEEFLEFCKTHKLQTNSSGIVNSESRTMLTFILGGIQLLGLLLLIASIWIVLLVIQTELLNNKKNIHTLRLLGHTLKSIHWSMVRKPMLFGLVLNGICVLGLKVLLNFSESRLQAFGFDATLGPRFLWVNVALMLVLLAVLYIGSLRKSQRIWTDEG